MDPEIVRQQEEAEREEMELAAWVWSEFTHERFSEIQSETEATGTRVGKQAPLGSNSSVSGTASKQSEKR